MAEGEALHHARYRAGELAFERRGDIPAAVPLLLAAHAAGGESLASLVALIPLLGDAPQRRRGLQSQRRGWHLRPRPDHGWAAAWVPLQLR